MTEAVNCRCKKKQFCEYCCPEFFEGDNYECGIFIGLARAGHEVGSMIQEWQEFDREAYQEEGDSERVKWARQIHASLWAMKKSQKENLPEGYNEIY